MRTALRVLSILAVLATWLAWAPSGAAAAPVGPAPVAAGEAAAGGNGTPSVDGTTAGAALPASANGQQIQVANQTLWVTPGLSPDFEIDLRFAGTSMVDARILVTICGRITARSNFDATLAGHGLEACSYSEPVSIASLPESATGARRVVVPLGQAGSQSALPAGALPAFYGLSAENDGAYPVQISLVGSNGVATGQPVTTYMVSTPGVSGLPKLGVAWVVPVRSGSSPASPLTSRQIGALAAESAALAAHPRTPLTLAVDPSTLAQLQASGPRGLQALAALSSLSASGDQLLPAPYVPIDVAGMVAAGEGAEVASQYSQGAQVLRQVLGQGPATAIWAFEASPLSPAAITQAEAEGAKDLVVPASSLSAAPAGKTTFQQTTKLAGYPELDKVAGSDSALSLHFTNSGDQILQAEQFLAELAMIDLESPGVTRGVAVVVPAGWQPTASFVETVLSGLSDSPLLHPETLQQFFDTVPIATGSGGADVSRSLLGTGTASGASTAVPTAASIAHARSLIASLSSTVKVSAAEAESLNNQLLAAESSALGPGQRKAAFAGLTTRMTQQMGKVSVAHEVSVTLTSTSADVPVTVLNSGSSPAKVQLVLTSQKLSFHPFQSPVGACSAQAYTTERCTLALPPGATLLKVPVETRTSGVFTLSLGLRSADGNWLFGQARYTVRSTAVSDVAVALMIGAALLLGAWWIRDRRHGRRARELIDPPAEDLADELCGEGSQPTGVLGAPAPAGTQRPPAGGRWTPAPPGRWREAARRAAADPGPPGRRD